MNNKNKLFLYGTIVLTAIVGLVLIQYGENEVSNTQINSQEYLAPRPAERELAQNIAGNVLHGKRVLLIGDSQAAGAAGRALQSFLMAKGVDYYTHTGRPGWGVGRWYTSRWSLRSLINRHQPDILIIMLGGNDWSRAGNPIYNRIVRDFWHFITRVGRYQNGLMSICWVGPVRVVGSRGNEIQPRREIISNIIENTIGTEHYIQSSDITGDFGRTGDGIHFTFPGARKWTQILSNRIVSCVASQEGLL